MSNIKNPYKIMFNEVKAIFLSSILCPSVETIPFINTIYITINVKLDSANNLYCDQLQKDLYLLCNQRAIYSFAKKSQDHLEIRKGMIVALNVTLRRQNKLNFLNNVTNFALKNLRDFEGFHLESFDNKGNYTFSNVNRLAFSEIEFNESYRVEKFIITLNIKSRNKKNCLLFLKNLGFIFNHKINI